MININNTWIKFNCPKCQYSLDIRFVDVKLEAIIFCHNCKTTIKAQDKDASAHLGAEKLNNALKSLEQALKKLGK